MFKKIFGFMIENATPKKYFAVCFQLFVFGLLGGIIGFLCGSSYMNEKLSPALKLSINSPSAAVTDSTVFTDNLKKNIPNLKGISISETGLNGLREVTIDDTGEIFYSTDDGNNIFIGAWIDEFGKNLTKERMDEIAKIKFTENMKNIDKSKAIKIGNGKNEVIEFTDVDCPFCKQAESFFSAPDVDVTRYVFFTPIDSLHPQAAKKSVHILCASDVAAEYQRVMAGEVKNFKTCKEGEDLLKLHRSVGEMMNVQGTPQFFVNGIHYGGADPRIYEAIKHK